MDVLINASDLQSGIADNKLRGLLLSLLATITLGQATTKCFMSMRDTNGPVV